MFLPQCQRSKIKYRNLNSIYSLLKSILKNNNKTKLLISQYSYSRYSRQAAVSTTELSHLEAEQDKSFCTVHRSQVSTSPVPDSMSKGGSSPGLRQPKSESKEWPPLRT